MASQTVVYRLVGRDDGAGKTMDHVGSKAGALEKGMGKLGKAVMMAGAALAAGLAVGAAESVKSAIEFQNSMLKIQTQAGGSAKDVKVLSAQVLELGKTTQQGPEVLADSLFHLKSVGMSNVDAMKSLKVATDLAAVGGADLESTTNALAGAWRTGIKGAQTFGEAAATVNAIIGAGNMRMSDLVGAIGTGFLPSAKAFGLSLAGVGAALATMTDEGIGAREAATRLRMSFSLLGAPSGVAEDQLKAIGLTGLQMAHAMRGPDGLIGAVQLLKDHIAKAGLSAEETSQLLSHAFGGGKSSSGILLMINNLDVMKLKQEQINASIGRFPAAVEAQRKTAQAQWKILVSNLEVMSIKVGTALLPPLTHFVQYLDVTALPAVVKFGRALVARLVPKDALHTAMQDAEDFVGGLVGKGPAKLTSAQLHDPARTAPGFQHDPDLPQPKAMTQAMKFGQELRETATQLVKQWEPVVKAAAGLAAAFVGIVVHTPAPVFQKIVDVLIATAITTRVLKLAEAFRGLSMSMALLGSANGGPVGLAIGGVVLLALVMGEFFIAGHSMGTTLTFFGEGFAQIGRGLATAGEETWKFLVAVFSIHGSVARAFDGAENWLLQIGKDIVGGLWWGCKWAFNDVMDFFRSIPDQVVNMLTSTFHIASPSRLMMPIGGNVILGLLAGAASQLGGLVSWFGGLPSRVTGAVGRTYNYLYGQGRDFLNGLRDGAVSRSKGLLDWISGIPARASSALGRTYDALYGQGRDVLNGFFDGLRAPWAKLQEWVGGLAGWIKDHKGPVSFDRGLLFPAGKALMGGLFDGLTHGWKKVTGFVSGIAGSLSGGVAGANQQLGKMLMTQMWSADQWPALRALWEGESGWNQLAMNGSSGAYGIPQALPASKMASAGGDWQTSSATQIRWGLDYIKSVYGSPGAAYNAWLSRNPHWYDSGGIAREGGLIPKLTNSPERVLSPRQTEAFEEWMKNGGAGAGGVDVHIHFNDPALRDLIDVQVVPKIKASEQRQAYRAKVGGR